jgi:hypothetical protein
MGIKVLNLRCHVGSQIGNGAQSFDSAKGYDMEMVSNGVFIESTKLPNPHFIPFGTIASVTLDKKSYEANKKSAESVKAAKA